MLERGVVEMSFFLICCGIFVYLEWLAGTKKTLPELRDFAILEGIKEGVGRAVELERPVLFLPGNAPRLQGDRSAMYIASFEYLKYVIDQCVSVGARPIVTNFGTMGAHVDSIIEEAYRAQGKHEQYDRNYSLRHREPLLSTIANERPATLINVGTETGSAYQIFPSAKQFGAITCGGTPRYSMMNAFVTGCDYLLIGDEFYGCVAKVSDDRHMKASIIGQDVIKWFCIVVAAVIFIAVAAAGIDTVKDFMQL
jgi:hypothetical protein